MVAQDERLGLVVEATLGVARDDAHKEVLHREAVGAEAELAADRLEPALGQGLAQRLGIVGVASGRTHRGIDHHDRVVALRGVEARQATVGLLEAGHELAAGRGVGVG
ncbi:hypothetical protein D3C85_1638630 [compost metagenome]